MPNQTTCHHQHCHRSNLRSPFDELLIKNIPPFSSFHAACFLMVNNWLVRSLVAEQVFPQSPHQEFLPPTQLHLSMDNNVRKRTFFIISFSRQKPHSLIINHYKITIAFYNRPLLRKIWYYRMFSF